MIRAISGLVVTLVITLTIWVGLRLPKMVRQPPAPVLPRVDALPTDFTPVPAAPTSTARSQELRYSSRPGFTVIEIELDHPVIVSGTALQNPNRVYFDLLDTQIGNTLASSSGIKVVEIGDDFVKRIRLAENPHGTTRVVCDLKCECGYSFVMSQTAPYQLVIDIESPARPLEGTIPLRRAFRR